MDLKEHFLQMLRNQGLERLNKLLRTGTTEQELELNLWTPPYFPELSWPSLLLEKYTWGTWYPCHPEDRERAWAFSP